MNGLSALDLWGLFGHFLMLSVLAIGGAMTVAPDMHRYVVTQHQWLSDLQFSASIAIAQAAPGPNVLFVAVVGWNVAGAAGVLAALGGMLLPSTALSLGAMRWGGARRETRGVRAFTAGLAPLTLGLLLSTGWLLAEPFLRAPAQRATVLLLIAGTLAFMLFTRRSPLWMIGVGAVAGALGWI